MRVITDVQSVSMQCALLALLAVGLVPTGVSAQSRTVRPLGTCDGPTNNVKVMALQDPDNEPAYLLVVKNGTKQSILGVTVGMGSKSELRIADFAVPVRMVAPDGWKATHSFHEDSEFMHWVWGTEMPDHALAPGELASGFKVVLPPFPTNRARNVYPDGTPVRPIKVTDLPFQVSFTDGKCVWGQIQPLVVGAKPR